MNDVNIYTAIGAALATVSTGAIIIVVSKFLTHIAKSDERQEKFLGNHMSQNTAAMTRVAERLERLEDAVKSPATVKVTKADEVEVNQ